jgi:hypothetical protein
MTALITKTPFTCELVTIHSKRSFAELIGRIESTFQHYDAKTLRDLTADGNSEKLAAYVKKVGEPTEFAIFFWLDQGSTQRLAGIPIESRFYLFGNATIAQGLFRYSERVECVEWVQESRSAFAYVSTQPESFPWDQTQVRKTPAEKNAPPIFFQTCLEAYVLPRTALELTVAIFPLIARWNRLERVPVFSDLAVFNAE